VSRTLKGPLPEDGQAAEISRADIESALDRIHRHVRRTPVLAPGPGAFGARSPLTLKLELLQHTGSFKPRGAFNRILSNEVPEAGVLAASGGNHGLGVAFAASRLGIPAEIFLPDTSPASKVQGIRALGATVWVVPGYYSEALAASRERAEESGALEIHAYDMLEVLAGQGTIGLELSDQAPDLDTVLVAVGGAGLIGGIASWYAGQTRVIGVEPERCPTLHASLAKGEPVDVEVGGVAADALGAARVGRHGFAAAERHVDRVILLPDEAIRAAQRRLWEEIRIVAEPGGAAALAALLSGAYEPDPDERVAVLVCGANTDPSAL
jgi:threonine dehydratase